jgi:hypothetical protein
MRLRVSGQEPGSALARRAKAIELPRERLDNPPLTSLSREREGVREVFLQTTRTAASGRFRRRALDGFAASRRRSQRFAAFRTPVQILLRPLVTLGGSAGAPPPSPPHPDGRGAAAPPDACVPRAAAASRLPRPRTQPGTRAPRTRGGHASERWTRVAGRPACAIAAGLRLAARGSRSAGRCAMGATAGRTQRRAPRCAVLPGEPAELREHRRESIE